LIKALDLNNQCDLNYKNANNKRLSVEITLMQIASFFLSEVDVKPEPPAFIAPANTAGVNARQQTDSSATHALRASVGMTTPVMSSDPERSEGESRHPSATDLSLSPTDSSTTLGMTAQQKTEPPTKPKSAFSLKSALEEPSKPEVKEENVIENTKQNTFEEIQSAWKSYSETQNNDPAYFNLLQTSELQLNEQTLEIVLASHVQERILLEKKTELMSFLRSKLSNSALQLKTIVNETKAQDILYTPSEKFAKLSEKNPELKRLREVLDLEIQY
jgi:DNA polymerase-3 subunit gamma/tau